MAIIDKLKKAKNKVIDVASDIMSAPARMKANTQMKKNAQNDADLKLVKETKGVSMKGQDYHNPIFRARANVAVLKYDAELERKKMANKPQTKDYQTEYAKRMSGKSNRF